MISFDMFVYNKEQSDIDEEEIIFNNDDNVNKDVNIIAVMGRPVTSISSLQKQLKASKAANRILKQKIFDLEQDLTDEIIEINNNNYINKYMLQALKKSGFKRLLHGVDQLSICSNVIFEDLCSTSLISISKMPLVLISCIKLWFGDILTEEVINYMVPCSKQLTLIYNDMLKF